MFDLLNYDFMQRAIIAAFLVGLAAPLVGIFLVQRRLALIGDGMGHVALAGVAVGVVTGTQPVWTALILTIASAVLVELVRARGRTSGDVALAVMFYGGIAIGVVLLSRAADGQSGNLETYLFGAITTTSPTDIWTFAALTLVIVVVTWVLRPRLFAVAGDEEYARATGMRVLALNITLAVLTAVTVVISMRIVGLLLISALMIVPNASAQLLTRSFSAALRTAVVIGVACSVGGVFVSYHADTPSGATIVVLTVLAFTLAAALGGLWTRWSNARHETPDEHPHEHGGDCGHPAVRHGDHVDYLHDGERHAAHADHWDRHPTDRTTTPRG
ncbi:metal ABC transporter permease [Demetria terragena]|uniref:metal ABC transporter permease n=1 Tax=Demetria terragena TaxID=63959 RepID=UPI00036EB473|nr:metal ABC transporter permease [Demetria terragena]